MKTATIKKSALALMACILALAFALVGCGGSKADPEEAFLGSWKLSGGEIYGESSMTRPSRPWKSGASTAS